tara:strand:+ start:3548 stop:4987 length:1440 start_codon:yes stop_codon:yes gene_type:complete
LYDDPNLAIDGDAQIFLVAPYWTSVASVGMPPDRRPGLLRQLVDELNSASSDPQYPWQTEVFQHPRTLKFRKFGQAYRYFELGDELVGELKGCLGGDVFRDVAARITYFDYGIGNIEVTICCTNIETIGVEEFSKRAEKAKLAMVRSFNAGMPRGELDLAGIDAQISSFLLNRMSGLENKLRPKYDKSVMSERASIFCGPVSRNVIFTDTEGFPDKFEASQSELGRAAFNFLNEADSDGGYTGSDKIPISHEGFEGAMALVRRSEACSQRVVKELASDIAFQQRVDAEVGEVQRTKLLWSMVHMYWSALFCASEGFFTIAASYGVEKKPSLSGIERQLDEIDEFQKIVSMIKFESQPEKIIVEGEDRTRYSKIWQAYDSENLLKSLDQILLDSSATLQSLRDRAHKIVQSRTTRIFTAFTLLTLLSVIADLIILYDVGSQIDAYRRIMALTTGAFILCGLAMAVWFLSSKIGRANRNWQ